jgi:para-aminobenzoate synthetase/4-amino-4-deoxychorismate lyase
MLRRRLLMGRSLSRCLPPRALPNIIDETGTPLDARRRRLAGRYARAVSEPLVRFDDLRTDPPASFALRGFVRELAAFEAADVVPTLREAEREARSGRIAAGFVSYEAAPGVDPTLRVRRPTPALPLAWFAVFERRENVPPPSSDRTASPDNEWTPSETRERYDASIASIRAHIEAGDTYQVNYTLRLRAPAPEDVDAFYAELCAAQSASYCASIHADGFALLSASPELFFEIDGDRITTRPMKGTIARGSTPDEDEAAAASLRASRKDRAENAMIVDLVRNDLGRIAVPGSVLPTDLFAAERYETVWQLTSTIAADLCPEGDLVSVFRALFPSGSVTGAPKVRTMQLIAELESQPRGVYTGAIGFVEPSTEGRPHAVFNVAIRTVVVDIRRGTAEYGVGGGITHDSSAEGEYEEALTKARVLTGRRDRAGTQT